MSEQGLAGLRVPFPAEAMATIKRGGVELTYVGHADITARLLDVDPAWNWEPLALGTDGLPLMDRAPSGAPIGLWIRLTVCGLTRIGYGSCLAEAREPEKELIGDAIRNAAMRFGCALELWARHREPAPAPAAAADPDQEPARHPGEARLTSAEQEQLWFRAKGMAEAAGIDKGALEDIVLEVLKAHGAASRKELRRGDYQHALWAIARMVRAQVAP